MSQKSDDDERLWNMLVYKMWMTDKERDGCFEDPAYWIFIVVILIFCLGAAILSQSTQKDQHAHSSTR